MIPDLGPRPPVRAGLAIAAMMVYFAACGGATISPIPTVAMAFSLTSPAFEDGAEIPQPHGCSGEDVSPQLDWTGAPAGAAELVLVVDDPDAGGFLHWLLTGIPAAPAGTLAEGRGDPAANPAGQGRNDFGRTGWGGPCPPRRHIYVFTLHALSAPIDLGPMPGIDAVQAAMGGLIVGETRLTGTYQQGG